MTRVIFRIFAIFLIAAITWQPIVAWSSDSYDEINDLAKEDREQLKDGIIDVEKFCGSPWYERHMGKLIAGGVIVIGGVAIYCTGGLATPPVHFLATGTSLSAAASATAITAGAGVYIDSNGDIKIPEDKKEDVYNFYMNNYKSWVSRSSTKKEFGETAIAEIVKFLEKN